MLIFFLLLGVLLCTTYGQIIIKARANVVSPKVDDGGYFASMLLDPWVLSALVAVAAAGFFWLAAIRRVDLTFAYPFVALTFVSVPVISYYLLGEALSVGRLVGIALIVAGVLVAALAPGV